MENWCIDFIGNHFFRTKLTQRRFPNFLFPRGIQDISVRRDILSTSALYILHPYKHTTEYISERASQQARETCLLNSEMPKKIHACPSTCINKSTERHPRVPSYPSQPFFTLLQIIPLQPAFIPSLQVRSGMETESFVSDCLLINAGRPLSVFKR